MAFRKIDLMKTADEGSIFYEFNVNGYQILLYQPSNDIQSNLINYGFTSPSFLVFPDKKSDFDDLRELAESSGLADLARENGCGVILVNPKGEDWKDEEPGAYEAVANNLAIAQSNFRDGLAVMKNDAIPDEVSYAILGSCVRMYAYGFGSGADYIGRYYLKPVSGKVIMGDLGASDLTIVSATLKGLSEAPKPETNDIHVVSIGNKEVYNEILKESCGALRVTAEMDLVKDFLEFTGNYRRWTGRILGAYNYEAEGIVCKAESVMLPIDKENAAFRRALRFMRKPEHKVGYVTFYDKNLDVHGEKHPLMLVFHGGGDSALATASLAEWPEIGQAEGFITVAVEMHLNVPAMETVALIDHLCKEYAIDETRIYGTGFSMGGIKSWDLYEQAPLRFAGLMPMDATDHVGNNCSGGKTENVNYEHKVPLLYVGGISSPLVELPKHELRSLERIKYLAKVNDLKEEFKVEFEDKSNWNDENVARKGDRVEVLHDDLFPNSEYNVHYYDSKDGNCYTCIMAISNHGHEIRPFTNRFAWNFIKKFSRQADGSIKID
ncbi:MAG: hypothetical protein IJM15_00305 [Erysipelotrichaceae bacterium]|nr:hypothetical protein [Erysipelotrichaceae bacterium]